MDKSMVEFDYRKCFKCGETTKDMQKVTCKCGGYMYAMGGCYTPDVKQAELNQSKKGAC